MAITKGLFAAVEDRLSDGSEGDTSSPIYYLEYTDQNALDV